MHTAARCSCHALPRALACRGCMKFACSLKCLHFCMHSCPAMHHAAPTRASGGVHEAGAARRPQVGSPDKASRLSPRLAPAGSPTLPQTHTHTHPTHRLHDCFGRGISTVLADEPWLEGQGCGKPGSVGFTTLHNGMRQVVETTNSR